MNPRPPVLGVFLLSASLLILELAYTRVFSIRLWNHFAAMSINVALLGLGSAGALLFARPTLRRYLAGHAVAFSLLNLVGMAVTFRMPFDIFNPQGRLSILVFYLALVLPFVAAGLYLSAVMAEWPGDCNRIYAWNLVGTAAGVVLAVALMPWLGAVGAVASASVFGLLAAAATARVTLTRTVLVGAALGLCLLLPGVEAWLPIELPPAKFLHTLLYRYQTPQVMRRWDITARVDVVGPFQWGAWGLAPSRREQAPPQLGITIDGDAFTPVTQIRSLADAEFLRYSLPTLPYQMRTPASVLVIGSGGGPDCLTARLMGATRVVGVDINSTLIGLLRSELRDFAGDLEGKLGIEQVVVDGRNYVRRSPERFDLIQIPLVDSFAATFSGAFSLSENFLYTREAFRDYYAHLSPQGMLNVMRFDDPARRMQVLRLLRLIADVSPEHLDERVVVARIGELMNITVAMSPLTPEEREQARRFCADNGFELLFLKGVQEDPQMAECLHDPAAFESSQALDLSVPTDDRPVFNQFHRVSRLPQYIAEAGSKGFPVVFMSLGWMLALSLGGCLLFVLLPLLLTRGRRDSRPKPSEMVYFVGLGLGFMLLELGLFQQLSLFLGHPAYSLSVVLFVLLIFTGVGSYLGGRVRPGGEGPAVRRALTAVIVLAAVAPWALPALVSTFLAWSLGLRIAITAVLLAALGCLLGLPFPLALRRQSDPSRLAWCWGVNACASVLGSTLATISCLTVGFSTTLLLGGLCYALALGQTWTWKESP